MKRARLPQRTCPICGVGLIATDTCGDSAGGLYQCPCCGLVIDVSVPKGKQAGATSRRE